MHENQKMADLKALFSFNIPVKREKEIIFDITVLILVLVGICCYTKFIPYFYSKNIYLLTLQTVTFSRQNFQASFVHFC